MRRRRIFYVDDIPTPYRLDVHQRITAEWDGEFKVAFCSSAEPGRDWHLDFEGVDCQILTGLQVRPLFQLNPFSFKYNPFVNKALKAYRPDVVVLSGYAHPTIYMAALWCRQHGVPYAIVSESTIRSSTTAGLKWQLKRRVAGLIVRGMAYGLPTGREAGEYLRMIGQKDAPMFWFPNTADTASIAADAARIRFSTEAIDIRRKLKIPDRNKIILFAGRLIEAKRPLDAIKAFRSTALSGTSLVVAGDGPLRDQCAAAAGGDERIVFTGWIKDHSVLKELMAISSVLVLPSIHETWGAVVNEAMASGVAVIASDRVGAAIELVQSGVNGFILPVGNVDEIARTLHHLVENEQERGRIALEAQRTALNTGIEFAVSNFIRGANYGIRLGLSS